MVNTASDGVDGSTPSTATELLQVVLDELRVLVIAGVTLGVLIGGVGGRLAMYLLRVTSPDHVIGLPSDDGFRIGEFTVGGTYNLLAVGAAIGLVGAAVYKAVSHWLIGPRWFRHVTAGAASGAVIGSMLIHDDGIDFLLLKPTWLAVGLFIAIPAAFGLLIGPAVDAVTPRRPSSMSYRRWYAVPVVLLALFALFPPTLFIALISGLVLLVWIPARQSEPVSRWRRQPWYGLGIRAGWLAVAVAGLLVLLKDIREIM